MLLFREGVGSPVDRGVVPQTVEAPADVAADPERIWVCRQCGQPVTRPDQGISVDGAHRHTFANPHGMVYEIGCFSSADGCAGVGPATEEFTWFAGFFWRIAVCRRCQIHLGWLFESRTMSRFHGLIFDRLAILSGSSGPGSVPS